MDVKFKKKHNSLELQLATILVNYKINCPLVDSWTFKNSKHELQFHTVLSKTEPRSGQLTNKCT